MCFIRFARTTGRFGGTKDCRWPGKQATIWVWRTAMNGWLRWAVLPALLAIAGTASAHAPDVDEAYFAAKVYPVLHAAQCERCHTDNGVASETQLEFPRAGAGPA